MPFKKGIGLLVLLTLLGAGSLIYGVDKKEAPPILISTALEENESKAVFEQTPGIKEEKAAAASSLDGAGELERIDSTRAATQNLISPAPNESPATARISITGTGIENNKEFTLHELKQMKDIKVNADYYSLGAEKPGWEQASHNEFTGILLYELLTNYAGLTATATQVKIVAEDQYMQIFTIEDIKADYFDETDSSKRLRMIISWSQDGRDYDERQGAPFCLVMGQQYDGDFNRQKWVKRIAAIEVE